MQVTGEELEEFMAMGRQDWQHQTRGSDCSEIAYMPGNHDHHIWQAAREAQYLNYLSRLAPGEPAEPAWDTTKIMMDMAGKDRLASGMATAIARRLPHLRERGFEILTAYPNFGVRQGPRTIVFHHGHRIEDAYRLMSTLACLFFPEQKPPEDVYALERENAAWIDFFWSTMGNCGRIGEDIETIYEASVDAHKLHGMTDTLARSIAGKYPLPKWAPRFLREWVLKAVLHEAAQNITGGLERRQAEGEAPLSPAAGEGLQVYVEGMVKRQLRQEKGSVPDAMTFIFGHTHKPFVDVRRGVCVLNTGGWVVDAPQAQSLHGAAVVLVAEDGSAVNVRLYNEGSYSVTVEEPRSQGAGPGPFCDQIANLIARQTEPWKSFGNIARAEVDLRIANLSGRLKSKSSAAGAGR